MTQRETFLAREGDEYYRRNRERLTDVASLAEYDLVLRGVKSIGLQPRAILEIGCSNGWRLEAFRREFAASCVGIDPSREAISEGRSLFPALQLSTGTADSLPFADAAFDLVILGFCLYLCDRRDLFRIAYEVDRVLADPGYLAILDFHPPFPYRNEYHHHPGIYTYKWDYAKIFLGNPAYSLIWMNVFGHRDPADIRDPDERVSVSILYKNVDLAYPKNPFRG